MASDIVERLRDQRYCGQEQLRHEAAAEIERLRGEKQVLLESGMQAAAKVAGLAAAADLYRRSAEWLATNDPGTPVPEWVTYDRQALAAADVECVRGWWNPRKEPEIAGDVGMRVCEDSRPCTAVIHKEQQHGA